MKNKYSIFAFLALAFVFLFSASCKNINSDTDINKLSPEEIRAISKEAYIFAYPLIMNYATMYKQAVDSSSPNYLGGFGKFRHYGFATSENKDIVSPNNDTPYSWAWVDVHIPWVLIMPPADESRYYTSQWDDMWGFVLDSPGSVLDGQGGGAYLLVAPNWQGETPKGIKRVIKGESYILGTLTRTGADGPEDLEKVKSIQAGYKLMPLYEYLNEEAEYLLKDIAFIPFVEGEEKTIEAFKYVNFILHFIEANAADKKTYERISKIGVAKGAKWDTSKFTDSTKEAIKAGIADAMKEMAEYRTKAKSSVIFNTRKVLGTDYEARMFGVFEGIFGNYATQAEYFSWHKDSDGNPINTANASYKLSFKKGETPSAKYFWSITMYNLPERFLVPNSIDRYSIGSRSKQLKTNEDGSIDIYISKTSPGKEFESNWLPAPNGEPFMVLRVYGPGKSVIDGSYKLPQLVKIK